MPRTFNYTNRKKIPRENVSIRLLRVESDLRFAFDLRLDNDEFPSDARVHVEAYRGLSALWKRFDFGRFTLIQPPADLSLNEFNHPEGILFRVKISAEGEHKGRLLGEADGIRPQLPDEQNLPAISMIAVDAGPLGGELWKVQFPDGESDMPVLVINNRIDDWSSRARDPLFRAIVLPSVMRQILTQILIIEADIGDEENPDSWKQRWLLFAEQLPNMSTHPDPLQPTADPMEMEELTEWIDEAVSAFGKRSTLTDSLIERWNAEEQS